LTQAAIDQVTVLITLALVVAICVSTWDLMFPERRRRRY
jgi:hypothetical protein